MRDLSEQKVSKRLTHPSRFVHQLLTWVKEVIRRAACTKQLLFWCSPEGLNLREKGISQHLQDKVGEKKKKTKKAPHLFMQRSRCSHTFLNPTLPAALNYSSARY